MTTKNTTASTEKSKINSTPRIYVACLASYNNSKLHGEWIDATQRKEGIEKSINNLLEGSLGEGWDIHDHEGFFGLELQSLDDVCQKATFIAEYGEIGAVLLRDCYVKTIAEAKEMLDSNYHGEWETKECFAEALFYDIYGCELADSLRCYINYAQFSWDLFANDYYAIRVNSSEHVFSQQ